MGRAVKELRPVLVMPVQLADVNPSSESVDRTLLAPIWIFNILTLVRRIQKSSSAGAPRCMYFASRAMLAAGKMFTAFGFCGAIALLIWWLPGLIALPP